MNPRFFIVVFGFFTIFSAIRAQELDTCVAARVPEAYVLPDGSIHEPGKLSLCLAKNLSPVTGLHRVAVEGHTLGLARSHRSLAESRDVKEPLVLFRRRDGRLELIGYVVQIDRKTWSYSLADPEPQPARGELVAVLGRRF